MSRTMTPYRILVFATGTVGRRKKPVGYAYMGWTEHQAFSEARLPGAGSFLFPGLHAAREAALTYLAQPETHQVAVRTNQDRTVYRYFKNKDERVSGYGGDLA